MTADCSRPLFPPLHPFCLFCIHSFYILLILLGLFSCSRECGSTKKRAGKKEEKKRALVFLRLSRWIKGSERGRETVIGQSPGALPPPEPGEGRRRAGARGLCGACTERSVAPFCGGGACASADGKRERLVERGKESGVPLGLSRVRGVARRRRSAEVWKGGGRDVVCPFARR
ncbi:hypothetical protein LZ30DRAFT_742765 [Colletotrichum cereale]|nr:hypothetical protein LZ30DRAFT_742765 [Colletotrichum cereale]